MSNTHNPQDGTPAKKRLAQRRSLPKAGDSIRLEKQPWALNSERWAHLPPIFEAQVKGFTPTGIRLSYEDPISGGLTNFRVSKVSRPNSSFRWDKIESSDED